MAMSKPVETPKEDIHTRVTRVETRLDTILQFVATKEDLAKLEGKMDARFAELEGKIAALAGATATGFANQRAETDAKLFRYSLTSLTILLSAIAVATTVILRALP